MIIKVKKKMLVIHHSGLLGGAGLSLESMVTILKKEFDLTVYVPINPDAIYKRLILTDTKVRSFKGRLAKITTYSGGNKFLSLRFIYHAIKIPFHFLWWILIIRREKPDFILVNSRVLCWFSLIPFSGTSICFVRETIDPSSNFSEKFLIAPLLKRFDARLFLSKHDRDSHGFNDCASLVSPDFIEENRYTIFPRSQARKDLNISHSKFVLCYVGGVDPLKGLSLLLKSANQLRKLDGGIVDKLAIIICGDIRKKSLYKYQNAYDYEDFKLVESFIENSSDPLFHKMGLQEDLSLVYSASNCLVFPMKKPHQSRPAFEIGLFAGFPILPDFNNVSEYFKDKYNAVIYKANSNTDLADKIIELITKRECCDQIGVNNRNETKVIRSASACLEPLIKFLS